MNQDPRVTAYIDNAAEFAKPLLNTLRANIQAANPALIETIKWNFPTYTYNGKIVCFFTGFKHHCAFGFWKAVELQDPNKHLEVNERTAMGNFGKMHTLDDLPKKELIEEFISQSIALINAKTK